MSDRSRPTRRPGPLPALCLVLLALLPGLADRHSHAGLAGGGIHAADRLVFDAAAHPWKALHVEPTGPGHVESPCPACLQLLRPDLARPRGVPGLAPPAPAPAARAAASAVRAGALRTASDPRAPPFA